MAVIQPRPTHIIYQCANISIFLASKVCPMLKYSYIYDALEPITIVIFN